MPIVKEPVRKTGRRKARRWLNRGAEPRLVPGVFALYQSLRAMIYEKCEGDAKREQNEELHKKRKIKKKRE